jgi:hypothetical protein
MMATLDVLTLDQAKRALRIGSTDTTDTVLLQSVISAVSRRIDTLCGPVVQRTITSEVIDTRGEMSIRTRWWPVASFTSVTSYTAGTGTTLTAETLTSAGGYLAERLRLVDGDESLLSGVLRRRSGFSDYRWPDPGRVAVTYVAGRYAATADVAGTLFAEAAAVTLVAWWRLYRPQFGVATEGEFTLPTATFPSFALPNAAADLLADERIHLIGAA